MSKRIVFAIWGSLGDLHPYLAIGRELKRRGHRCVIATNKVHRERVHAAELDFAPLGPHLEADPVLLKKSLHLRRGPRFLIRDLVIPYTRTAFQETISAIKGADLLVTHPITYGAHLAAENSGICWASTALAPAGMFSVHDHSLRSQSPWLSKVERAGPWLDRTLMKIARHTTSKWVAPILKLRTEIGLPQGGNPIFEGQFSPQLTLALFSSLIGPPQPDWPQNTVVTGFPFYCEPVTLDARLLDFLHDGEPPVVFTLGSSASLTPGKFFHESLKAVARLQCRALLIVGSFAPNQFDGNLPPHVAAFPYAPYAELFPHSAVNVHQGGIGTTAEALRSGRPALVVPFAFDQPDNAARARRLGVARSIFIGRYTGVEAARELEMLLHDTAYATKAAKLGAQLRAEDGVRTACAALEKLMGTRA